MQIFTFGSATAKAVCDSTYQGSRLVSIEVEFPRPFLAEFNTHCRFSRNSASSRAIPVWKRIASVLERPYIPNSFGVNKAGMQAGEELSPEDRERVVQNWLFGRDMAVLQAYALIGGKKEILSTIKGEKNLATAETLCDKIEELAVDLRVSRLLSTQDKGLHKQHANRVLETYSFHSVIATSTHWRNFFGLRASLQAQPEARDFALAMAKAMQASTPKELEQGQWHLPYIRSEDFAEASGDQIYLAHASAGKCARLSYLTQDGIRALSEDMKLSSGLLGNGHMSPFQHPTRPRERFDREDSNGNYSKVWTQLRKTLPNEQDFSLLAKREDLLLGFDGDEGLMNFVLALPE